jgi:DNA-directed RNA polymerase subunit omega
MCERAFARSIQVLKFFKQPYMNSELVKKALEKVANPGVLVNLISRRVRQLNTGYGGASRPMVADIGNLGVADIALREIIEDKMGFEMPEVIVLVRPTAQNRKRPQGWARFDPTKSNGEQLSDNHHP